jgi:glycosyltransferase involved in cell wall biosynthesis
MNPSRICIEASPALQQQAGLGRYTAGLIQGLCHNNPQGDYAIAYNDSTHTQVPPPYDTLIAYKSKLSNKPWRMRVAFSYWGRNFDRYFPDVALYHSTGHLLPRFRRIKTVFTLHDLIPLRLPQYHLWQNRWFLHFMFPRFLNAADAIIAVSEHTSRDAQSLLGIAPEKITVIGEAVEPHFRPVQNPTVRAEIRQKYHLPEQFILCVSTIEPRKNLNLLLDIYPAIRAQYPNVALVLAGKPGWLYADFFAKLQQSGLGEVVLQLGRVPEADLPALLSAATIFVYPSLYEGFGLPPLEAMACGVPVVCSNASSLPEVVGKSGVLLPPTDAAKWTQALLGLLANPAKRHVMSIAGRQASSRFRWETVAQQTQQVYDRLLA